MSFEGVRYKYEKRSGCASLSDGTVRYSLSVPQFFDESGDIYSQMNLVYMGILENCLSFCQGKIVELFGKRELIYSLDCRVTYFSGDTVCVAIEAVAAERRENEGVYKGASRVVLQRSFHADIWERGELLPPSIALSRFLPKEKTKKKIRKNDSVLVDDSGVFLIKAKTGDKLRIDD